MKSLNAISMKLDSLPNKKTLLRVPITKAGDILLSTTGERPEPNGKIVVSRKKDGMYVCRKDGLPIQIGKVFPSDRYTTGIDASPVMKLRRVLKLPLSTLVLRQQSEDEWLFDGALRDPETGPEDIRKFFSKIASVSLGKQSRLKSAARGIRAHTPPIG